MANWSSPYARGYGRQKPIGGAVVDWTNPLTRGLLAYWPLTEACGFTCRDLVKRGLYDLTLTSPLVWGSGYAGRGVKFAAGANWGETLNQIVSAGNFTFALLVFPTVAVNAILFSQGTTAAANIMIGLTSANLWKYSAAGSSTTGTITWAVNTLHRVVLTYDNSRTNKMVTYVDGIQDATSVSAAVYTGDRVHLGNSTISSVAFTGLIFDGIIWNRALPLWEIQQLQNEPYSLLQQPAGPRPVAFTVAGTSFRPYRRKVMNDGALAPWAVW